MSVTYNGTAYYYATNLQGDVVAILNSSGTAVVRYTYDAWGKLLTTTGTMASTLGVHNPLRYRSYVYDTESGLYYLQSRYYNPTIGRFLNADVVYDLDAGLQGYNLFLYCANDPIGRIDISGTDSEKIDDLDLDDHEVQERGGKGRPGRPRGSGKGSSPGSGGGAGSYTVNYGHRGTLKANMLKEGPAPSGNYQAHHGLPWQYRDYFAEAGLNVSDTTFGRWVKGGGNGGHQSWSRAYGKIWEDYIARNPFPDISDIIDYFYRLN